MATQRTLSEHAAYELAKAGMTDNEDPEARKVATDVMALVRRFEKQNHNDKSGPFVLEAFETLCTRLPLTPITDDPEEWDKFETERTNLDTKEVEKRVIWQSKRAPSLFSEDEGKTAVDQRTGKTVECVDHKKQAEEWAKAKEDRAKRKAEAEERAKNPAPAQPIGHVSPDVPAGEATLAPEETAQPNDSENTEKVDDKKPKVNKSKKETK